MKMISSLSFACICIASVLNCGVVAQDIRVQHALTADGVDLKFTPRGILKRSEEGSKFEQDKLSASEAEALKALAANDGFYHVRVETHPGKNDDQYVSSLVRACTLVSSKLKDELGIHMNENGDVIALEYRPTNVTCANKFFAKKIVDGSSFKTTIKLRTRGMPGPIIPTAEFSNPEAPHIEYDEEGRAHKGKPVAATGPDGEPVPTESFFQKYWMYIIPAIVIFNLVTAPASAGGEAAAEGTAAAAGGGGGAKRS